MAKVRVGLEYKRNMQNFENCTVRIEIEDDARNGETSDETFNRVYNKVEALLIKKVEELELEISHTEAQARKRKKS